MNNQNDLSKVQHVGVSALIRNHKGEILIISRAAHDSHPGIWESPGGGVEWGEDPKEALKREVKEEVGLDVEIQNPIDLVSYTSEKDGVNRHIIQLYFTAALTNSDQTVKLSSEHAEYRWIELGELKDLYKSVFLERLLQNK